MEGGSERGNGRKGVKETVMDKKKRVDGLVPWRNDSREGPYEGEGEREREQNKIKHKIIVNKRKGSRKTTVVNKKRRAK